jgi:DNA-binding CsgD family transcriptional regulator
VDLDRLFWGASVDDLVRGYVELGKGIGFACVVCGHQAERGRIYPIEECLYESEAYMRQHIKREHGSIFQQLIRMDKRWTGLTEVQKDVLQAAAEGMSDAQTAKRLGGKASTVRYHRFHLREKEKQAKVFLAIMGLLAGGQEPAIKEESETEQSTEEFVPIHRTATMVDERYAVTEEEREKILRTYFPQGPTGPLKELPAREKRKIIVLKAIAGRFERDRRYTEKEVNEVLKGAHPDFATLRRYMIEYGFMDREADCSAYWLRSAR